jgi:hypothetical protein
LLCCCCLCSPVCINGEYQRRGNCPKPSNRMLHMCLCVVAWPAGMLPLHLNPLGFLTQGMHL